MDLKRLGDRAKALVDKRGGTESVKRDAEQLRGIAKGPGSLADKARAAAAAIKDPGGATTSASSSPVADAATDTETHRAEEKLEGESRGKHAGAGHGHGHGGGRKGGGRGARQGGGDPGAV